jgi:tRNA modification GTPase
MQAMSASKEHPTCVIRLTPPGRGAIATLRVEGPDALKFVETLIRTTGCPRLADCPTDRVLLGRFGADGKDGEPVVFRRMADDAVQLHCHGGLAAVARIESALAARGCQRLAWRDWVNRSHEDTIQAAARLALADARTERVAAVLLDQYHGALRRALDAIRVAMTEGDNGAARSMIDALLTWATFGEHLIRPWRVVLAGRPNVGKSSLLNAMLGYRRAIVHDTPGTTRDVVTADTAIDGWPVELSDTAGLRGGEDPIERAGVERAETQLTEADLIVLIFDAAESWCDADRELVASWPSALVVHNKRDLAPKPTARPAGLLVSAATGEGIEELLRAIADRLVPLLPPPGAAVPWTLKQVESLRLLSDALGSG